MYPTGAEIKTKRQELGLTQTDLANAADITRKYVGDIEKGSAQNVSKDVMLRICKALGFITNVTDPSIPIEVHIAKLRAGYETREMDIASCVDLGEELRKSIDVSGDDPSITGEYFLLMAQIYNAAKRYSEALRCSLVAVDVFSKSGDRLSWAKAYFEGSNTTYERGQFATALDGFLVIVDRIGSDYEGDSFMAIVHRSIAICAASLGDVDLMREHIDKSKSGVEDMLPLEKCKHLAILAYLRGDSSYQSRAYKDAIDFFTRAHFYYKEINDSRAEIRMRHNIADALFQVGEVEEAKKEALEVFRLKQEIQESSTVLAETLILLGDIAIHEKDYVAALEYASVIDRLEGVDSSRWAKALRIKARVRYISGDLTAANVLLTEAMDVLEHRGHISLAVEIMREYMRINHMKEPKVMQI